MKTKLFILMPILSWLFSACSSPGKGFAYEKENYDISKYKTACIDVPNTKVRASIASEIEKNDLKIVEKDCEITLFLKTQYLSNRVSETKNDLTIVPPGSAVLQGTNVIYGQGTTPSQQAVTLFAFQTSTYNSEVKGKIHDLSSLKEYAMWWAFTSILASESDDKNGPNEIRNLCGASKYLADRFNSCNENNCRPW